MKWARAYAPIVMSTDESKPAAAPPEGTEKRAGRTGEGSASIVNELAHEQRRVDALGNRSGRPEPDADTAAEAT